MIEFDWYGKFLRTFLSQISFAYPLISFIRRKNNRELVSTKINFSVTQKKFREKQISGAFTLLEFCMFEMIDLDLKMMELDLART